MTLCWVGSGRAELGRVSRAESCQVGTHHAPCIPSQIYPTRALFPTCPTRTTGSSDSGAAK